MAVFWGDGTLDGFKVYKHHIFDLFKAEHHLNTVVVQVGREAEQFFPGCFDNLQFDGENRRRGDVAKGQAPRAICGPHQECLTADDAT